MSRYELLLFLHLLSAFALVAGTLCLFPYVFSRVEGPVIDRLFKLGGIASAVGGMGTLIFGLLLIWDVEYRFFELWIVGAIILWLVGTGAGERIGRVERPRANPLLLAASASVLLILVLMIWKPGA
jgi:hypothetical protein